jgi:hypothetical protein
VAVTDVRVYDDDGGGGGGGGDDQDDYIAVT